MIFNPLGVENNNTRAPRVPMVRRYEIMDVLITHIKSYEAFYDDTYPLKAPKTYRLTRPPDL